MQPPGDPLLLSIYGVRPNVKENDLREEKGTWARQEKRNAYEVTNVENVCGMVGMGGGACFFDFLPCPLRPAFMRVTYSLLIFLIPSMKLGIEECLGNCSPRCLLNRSKGLLVL